MKRSVLSIVFCVLSASAAFAQTKSPIEGVWRITERIMPGTNSRATGVATPNTDPASLIIFTRGYYSQTYEVAERGPRAAVAPAKDPQNLTDAEKIARYEQWNGLFARAGTYEIKGSTLTIRAIVAKNVNLMNSSYSQEFKLEDPNTLWLIPRPDLAAIEPRIKLTRLE